MAVTFFPNEHIHYLSLAQLVDPEDAIELYLNGADILRNKGPKEESDFICLSRIYCSIAELYIADLCHHEKADESAHKFLALARDAGPVSEKTKRIVTVEILYLQAQLHLNQSNKDEAVSSLMSSYSEYKKLFEIRHKESSALDSAQLPSFELRVQMAKLALELQLPDLCLDILAECLEERDDLPDIYYFIGLAHFAFVKGGLEGDDEDGSRAIENLKTAKKVILDGCIFSPTCTTLVAQITLFVVDLQGEDGGRWRRRVRRHGRPYRRNSSKVQYHLVA